MSYAVIGDTQPFKVDGNHLQETTVIQIKDTCSLANHLSVIPAAWSILVCCLQLNLWWTLPFYFLQIKTAIFPPERLGTSHFSGKYCKCCFSVSVHQVTQCRIFRCSPESGMTWAHFLSSLGSAVVVTGAVPQPFSCSRSRSCVETQQYKML